MLNKKAFTLIEIIVVVSIILVILAISLANYGNFTEEKKLAQDASNVANILEMAKKRTISGDDQCGEGSFHGYFMTNISNSYSLKVCCSLTNCDDNNQTIKVFDYSGANYSTTAVNIYFAPLTGHLYNTASQTITVKNKILNKCMDITVSQQGVIEENKIPYSC